MRRGPSRCFSFISQILNRGNGIVCSLEVWDGSFSSSHRKNGSSRLIRSIITVSRLAFHKDDDRNCGGIGFSDGTC